MMQVSNKAARACSAKGQRITPKVPLEDYDGEGAHTSPDHGERRLSSCETRVQEAQARNHEQDHA
jgi:hypothetical protein